MPVDTKHPHYNSYVDQWKICSDTYGGSVSVKAEKSKYLPKLTGQTEPEYEAYLLRAMFGPFMMRTVQGLTGAANFKEFEVTLPESIGYMEQNATGMEASLQSLIKQACTGMLTTGRIGILVDRPNVNAGAEEAPPYLVYYTAQQIINWREENGKLTLVVLEELLEEVNPVDTYSVKLKTVWRVLSLVSGAYTQEVWEKTEGGGFIQVQVASPTKRAKALDYIPFVIINTYGIGTAVDKPPLYDLATVNISHYQNSADLEHGRHFTGLPILFLTGISDENPIKVGSSTALVATDPAANGRYIEFTGSGLSTLEKALETKEMLMAVLGARLLESQRPGVEAADTVRLRQMGDVFTLASLNISLADGISKALSFAHAWQGGSGEVIVTPNKDFSDTSIDPAEIQALMALWQSGGISLETLLFNLERGEKLPPDTDIEDEIARIDLQRAKSSLPELTPEEKDRLKQKSTKRGTPDEDQE